MMEGQKPITKCKFITEAFHRPKTSNYEEQVERCLCQGTDPKNFLSLQNFPLWRGSYDYIWGNLTDW